MKTIEDYRAEQNVEMSAPDAAALAAFLTNNGVVTHVDGGWGVDALLGEQTRAHEDLDIAVSHGDVPRLRELLRSRSYKEILRDDTRACNFVLADDAGHMVDVHSYLFNADGDNMYGCPYPLESLTGVGVIADQHVRCISPAWIVKFHTGYEPDMDDYRDVAALCERFGLELPAEYDRFRER